ncbi:PPR: pentatricopeptide repeat domain containing protein [Nitzschia inconspicua]|uniref:PPR: pentatricopeptide repeat domain containing protein n=1 Tax=Nitzschia inconspicua TaxID=303405 RepID=A0A9K3KZY5_9STRA|nr:PPR: pentatricopeptide repeat domain containing protein [Nitzschia inconspicua]
MTTAKVPSVRQSRRNALFLRVASLLFLSNTVPSFCFVTVTRSELPATRKICRAAYSDDNYGFEERRVRASPRNKPDLTSNQRVVADTRNDRLNSDSSLCPSKKRSPVQAVKFNKKLKRILQDGRYLSVEGAEHLLLQRVRRNSTDALEEQNTKDYDTFSFNLILSAWARQRSIKAARRADALLQILLKNTGPHVHPDEYSYSAVLNAYAKSGGKRQAALRAEELLNQMETTLKITTDVCHNSVMECWAMSNDDDAGRRAQVWLTRLEENKFKLQRLPHPTRIAYNICLKAWARSKNGALQAHNLLNRMNALSESSLKPDKISYSTCMDAYCRSTTNLTLATDRAESLLREMEESSTVRPDVFSYTSLLKLYATVANIDIDKALSLIGRMNKYAKEEPNDAFLNTLIHFFAKKGKPLQAESVLNDMKQKGMADKISFTSTICSHAHSGNATRARSLFNELVHLYNTEKTDRYLPTEKTFTALIHSIAKSSDASKTSVNKVDELLKKMQKLYKSTRNADLLPSTVSYSTVFYLLSKSKDASAPKRAMELLNEMKVQRMRGNSNVNPDATTYAYIVNIFTKARVPHLAEKAGKLLDEVELGFAAGDGTLRPSQLLYSAVLQAFAKSGRADLCESLLLRTKELYKQGKMYAKPTALYYNAVMDGLARSRQGEKGAFRASEYLLEMEFRGQAGDVQLSPSTRSYNAAILAWKMANSTQAPQRAEALLKRMNDRYASGDEMCRPDKVTINTIMSIWANSDQPGAAARAEEYLRLMEEMFVNAGDESLKPDRISYNMVIQAYARSGLDDAGVQVNKVFNRMKMVHLNGDREVKLKNSTLVSIVGANPS